MPPNSILICSKYIPNSVAKKFDVSWDTHSLSTTRHHLRIQIDKVLKMGSRQLGIPEHRQKLAYVILVELLAYQFASVRWIETQDLLFKGFAFERFIEIGPSPTLTGMATRTLKAKYAPPRYSLP
jgi:fatty acid synthase subunit beta